MRPVLSGRVRHFAQSTLSLSTTNPLPHKSIHSSLESQPLFHTSSRHFILKALRRRKVNKSTAPADPAKPGSSSTSSESAGAAHWDPYDAPFRDATISSHQVSMIQKQAQIIRQRELKQIEEMKRDKKRINNPFAGYSSPTSPPVKPLPKAKRIEKIKAFFKNPKSFIPTKFFHNNPEELSFSQRCLYIYWGRSLITLLLTCLIVPRIPFVRQCWSELSRWNYRRRTNTLGLEEYCTPIKMNTNLQFVKTGDFSFDVRFLQKTALRDIYVLRQYTVQLQQLLQEHNALLSDFRSQLQKIEISVSHDGGKHLSPIQRSLIPHTERYQQSLDTERITVREISQSIVGWGEVFDSLWLQYNTDLVGQIQRAIGGISIPTFLAPFISARGDDRQTKLDNALTDIIERSKSLQQWREEVLGEINAQKERNTQLRQSISDVLGIPLYQINNIQQEQQQQQQLQQQELQQQQQPTSPAFLGAGQAFPSFFSSSSQSSQTESQQSQQQPQQEQQKKSFFPWQTPPTEYPSSSQSTETLSQQEPPPSYEARIAKDSGTTFRDGKDVTDEYKLPVERQLPEMQQLAADAVDRFLKQQSDNQNPTDQQLQQQQQPQLAELLKSLAPFSTTAESDKTAAAAAAAASTGMQTDNDQSTMQQIDIQELNESLRASHEQQLRAKQFPLQSSREQMDRDLQKLMKKS